MGLFTKCLKAARSSNRREDVLLEAKELSDEDRKNIIADFKSWTGGWEPKDSDEDEIKKYIEYSLPYKMKLLPFNGALPFKEAVDFLYSQLS